MTTKRNSFSFACQTLCYTLLATNAFAQTSGVGNLAQPIVTILQSVQQTLLGPLGISVFIIGLGAIGFMCLRSIVPWGAVVAWVLGACFLFGAPTIVNAIQSAIGNGQ